MTSDSRVPRGRSSAAEVAQAIAQSERQGNPRLSYRQFIQLADDLAAVDPVTKRLLTDTEPVVDGGRWYDAIAALVEHRLTAVGAPVPAWVTGDIGQPDEPWAPQQSAVALPFPVDVAQVANRSCAGESLSKQTSWKVREWCRAAIVPWSLLRERRSKIRR